MRFMILLLAIGCAQPEEEGPPEPTDEENISTRTDRCYCAPWDARGIVFEMNVSDALYYELRLQVSPEYADWHLENTGVEYPSDMHVIPFAEPGPDGFITMPCASVDDEFSKMWNWGELMVEWRDGPSPAE